MKAEDQRVRIEELRLAGFRAFDNARLALDDLTVLVGRNGAGKSTLVDAFEFLREALTDSLENALERRGGIQAVMRKGARSCAVWVGLRLPRSYIPEDALPKVAPGVGESVRASYGFRLRTRNKGKGFFVANELTQVGSAGRWLIDPTSDGAGMYDTLSLPVLGHELSDLRALLGVLRASPLTYKLSATAIRAEPSIGRVVPLSHEGSNVGDVLKRLEKNEDDIDWIVRHLSAITPGIVGIKAGTAAGRRIVQFLQSAGGTKPNRFEIGDMSDGTLRSLAILLALRQKPTPALVCIDEIEDSVHPSALAVLLDAVEASTERCQVLLTSHSPEALAHHAVTAGRVRVVDWNAGKSEIFRLSKGAAEAARPPRSVGTLLRSNALFTEEQPERVDDDFFEDG
jgi:predicted ATPase